jgi:hypothetical protein
MSAEQFNLVRRAATSVARNSLESRTTWIILHSGPSGTLSPIGARLLLISRPVSAKLAFRPSSALVPGTGVHVRNLKWPRPAPRDTAFEERWKRQTSPRRPIVGDGHTARRGSRKP